MGPLFALSALVVSYVVGLFPRAPGVGPRAPGVRLISKLARHITRALDRVPWLASAWAEAVLRALPGGGLRGPTDGPVRSTAAEREPDGGELGLNRSSYRGK